MTKPTKTPHTKPQPLTTHYLEQLAHDLVQRGLATTNILESRPKERHHED